MINVNENFDTLRYNFFTESSHISTGLKMTVKKDKQIVIELCESVSQIAY